MNTQNMMAVIGRLNLKIKMEDWLVARVSRYSNHLGFNPESKGGSIAAVAAIVLAEEMALVPEAQKRQVYNACEEAFYEASLEPLFATEIISRKLGYDRTSAVGDESWFMVKPVIQFFANYMMVRKAHIM